MNFGHPCSHCREGCVRPFQFSLDQAVLRCDNTECESLLISSPWQNVINRNIRQQVPRRSANFGHHRFWEGSSNSSGVQLDVRSPLLSPAQSMGSVTDKEVELLLLKSYAPSKFVRNKSKYSKKCPVSPNFAAVPADFQPPVLKDDSKCDSFFELLGSLDLDSPAHVRSLTKESPPLTSSNDTGLDIVTAELESWMKGFESPTFNNGINEIVCTDSIGVKPSSTGPNSNRTFRKNISESRISEQQKLIIPSQRSAFSQISPMKEKSGLNDSLDFTSDLLPSSPLLEVNADIKKKVAQSYQENDTKSTSLTCPPNHPVNYDLSVLCDSQFLSPAASAASDDSGYNEEDTNKVSAVALPHLQDENHLSSCSKSNLESVQTVEANETSKCKSVLASSHNLKSIIAMDLELSACQALPHFNIHPAMVTIEKCLDLNEQTGVESELSRSQLPVDQSAITSELPLSRVEGEVKADNDSEAFFFENSPSSSGSFNADLESNNIHSASKDDIMPKAKTGANLIIEPSQAAVIQEHCDSSSQFGSSLLSDIAENVESKASCSDHSSDTLSFCSVTNINRYNTTNRGRRRGRGKGRKKGKAHQFFNGCRRLSTNNLLDSSIKVCNNTVPILRGRGRGRGRASNRGRGQDSLNNTQELSKSQPNRSKLPSVMLPRQTRQRTGTIEVQAPTVPRGRFCDQLITEDSYDGNIRRSLSTLLQGPSLQIPDQRSNHHNRNLTNLSFRSLLSGSLAKDPWSVMELSLEEVDIEVVVQGVHSSDVLNEGMSAPDLNEMSNGSSDTSRYVHCEELKETDTVTGRELKNKCLSQVYDNAECRKMSQQQKTDKKNCSEISFSNIFKDRTVAHNIQMADKSTLDTKSVGISKELGYCINSNNEKVCTVKVFPSNQHCITSHIPQNYKNLDQVSNIIEVKHNSKRYAHYQPKSSVEAKKEQKVLKNDNQNINLKSNKNSPHIQTHIQLQPYGKNKELSQQQYTIDMNKEPNFTVTQLIYSLGESNEGLKENKQSLVNQESSHNQPTSIQKQTVSKGDNRTQSEKLNSVFGTFEEQKMEATQNNSQFEQFESVLNEIKVNKEFSQAEETIIINPESSLSITNYENINISQNSNNLLNKSKGIDSSLQKNSLIPALPKHLLESVGLISESNNSELQCTKEEKKDTVLDSLPQKEIKNKLPTAESSTNASLHYLLTSSNCENIRSWMGCQEKTPKDQAETLSSINEVKNIPDLSKHDTEARTKNSSSKYFGSLLQDVVFDDEFFQCPLQEHPSKTFEEHITSSLFFGETANTSPQASYNETSNSNQASDAKRVYYVEQYEKFPEKNSHSLKCTDFQFSEQLTIKGSEKAATQVYSTPVSSNITTGFLPTKLSVLPSTVSPSGLTFTSTVSASSTATPIVSCNYVCTTSVLPTVMSVTIPTVSSVAINTVPICSSVLISGVSALSKKYKRQPEHKFISKVDDVSTVKKEIDSSKQSLLSVLTNTVKVNNKLCLTNVTKDISGKLFLSNITSAKSTVNPNNNGCGLEGNFSTSFPSTSVNFSAVKCEDEISKFGEVENMYKISGTSKVTKSAEKSLTEPAENFTFRNTFVKHDPDFTHDEDNESIPIISMDSEDEIQIIIPEKRKLRKTRDVSEPGYCESQHETNSVCLTEKEKRESCVCGTNSEFCCEKERETHTVTETNLDRYIKVDLTLDQGLIGEPVSKGRKRIIEKSDETRPTKKTRAMLNIMLKKEEDGSKCNNNFFNSSRKINTENRVLVCGILDNSVVHDKQCYSPRVKEFVDFDESARGKNYVDKFYFGSKKSRNKESQERSVTVQFEPVMKNDEDSYTLKQGSTAQRNVNQQISQIGNLRRDSNFGCAKSSPQHEINSPLSFDISDPGMLELDCAHSGFFSLGISSSGSCTSSPEPSQEKFGAGDFRGNLKPYEGSGNGPKISDLESRLRYITKCDTLGSGCDNFQITSNSDKSFNDVSEKQIVSEYEDSERLPNNENSELLSNMRIQITNSEGQFPKCLPFTNSQCMNNKSESVDTNPSRIVKISEDAFKLGKAASTVILTNKCVPTQTHLIPVYPIKNNLICNEAASICSFSSSSLSSSHARCLESEEKNSLKNQDALIIPSVKDANGSIVARSKGELNLPLITAFKPSCIPLSKLLPLMPTCTNMQICHRPSQCENRESVIDYQASVSPKKLTTDPQALVASFGSTVPNDKIFMQANSSCNLREIQSTSNDKTERIHSSHERIIAVTSQTTSGPVTQVLRVAAPLSTKPSQLQTDNNQNNGVSEGENVSIDGEGHKASNKNKMLKKIKMGSNGGFYFRPTSSLLNSILQMRKKEKIEAANENDRNSTYLKLPDGKPISHPMFVPKKSESQIHKYKKKKKLKRDRKTKHFAMQKVMETVEQRIRSDTVPEMVAVCVGGKLHIYHND